MKPSRYLTIAAAALMGTLLDTPSVQAMTVKSVAAPSGMEVWLSEEHSLPVISASVSLPGGSSYDPGGKAGLAAMAASLLDEGAGDLDANGFKQALQAKAIRFSARAERDYIVVTLTTLTENADEAFRLLEIGRAHV